MTDRRQQLLAGGRVLAKSLGQQNTRDEFARNGMSMDAQVVLTIESEPLRDVMARTRRHEPPVVLAVYYPDSGRLDFLTVEPGREPDVEPGDSGQVGDGATIGMLAEYLRQRSRRGNRGWTFKMGASNRELDRIADSVHVFA